MVDLGDKVKDIVSGFQGIAIARYSYLQGCTRICVQPPVDGDGKLPATETFDEPQLAVLVNNAIAQGEKTDNGGPEKYPPPPRIEP